MRKRPIKIGIICIISLIALPLVYPVFSPWSRVKTTEHDVDLDTGRHRVSKYIYWVNVNTSYHDTAISKAVYDESLSKEEGDWVRVSTFGAYTNHSPHHAYHSVINQMGQLQIAWLDLGSDKASREKHSRKILDLWKTHGSDKGVDEYIQNVYEGSE